MADQRRTTSRRGIRESRDVDRIAEITSSATPDSQGGFPVGGAVALALFVVFLGLFVTYHWWRPHIPLKSFFGWCPCLVVPIRTNCHNTSFMNCRSAVVTMTPIMSHAATRGTCTPAVADSFCSADAQAFEQRARLSVSSDAGTLQLSQDEVQDAGPGASTVRASTNADQSLPFPLRFKPDGEPEIHYLPVYSMNVKAMRQQCLQLNLPSSGTKAILRERLEGFSHNRNLWDSLRPGARKAHKGPRTGLASKAKARRAKQSTHHRAQLLGEVTSDTTTATRSKDTRTIAEVAALLPWADAINHAFPYAPTDGHLAPAASTLPCSHVGNSTPASAGSFLSAGADASLQDAIVWSVGTRLVDIVQGALLQPSTVQVELPAGPQDASTSTGCTPEQPAPATEPSTKRTRILKLGNGTMLQVADDEIPDPPAISFVNDIPRLNEMWDDHTAHWRGISVINIQGHPIAIEYWPLLYRYGHDQQWKGTKNKWTDWRDVIKRYRQGTPEQFWAKFRAANGEPLKFTAIVHRLREERKDMNFALMERAREEYGSDFFFTYRKGGEEHAMTRPSAIAKKYKELMVSNSKEVSD